MDNAVLFEILAIHTLPGRHNTAVRSCIRAYTGILGGSPAGGCDFIHAIQGPLRIA
jgi:hypothetical protein